MVPVLLDQGLSSRTLRWVDAVRGAGLPDDANGEATIEIGRAVSLTVVADGGDVTRVAVDTTPRPWAVRPGTTTSSPQLRVGTQISPVPPFDHMLSHGAVAVPHGDLDLDVTLTNSPTGSLRTRLCYRDGHEAVPSPDQPADITLELDYGAYLDWRRGQPSLQTLLGGRIHLDGHWSLLLLMQGLLEADRGLLTPTIPDELRWIGPLLAVWDEVG